MGVSGVRYIDFREHFGIAVSGPKGPCSQSGDNCSHHFAGAGKMVSDEKDVKRVLGGNRQIEQIKR
jgi:hypothetical protein